MCRELKREELTPMKKKAAAIGLMFEGIELSERLVDGCECKKIMLDGREYTIKITNNLSQLDTDIVILKINDNKDLAEAIAYCAAYIMYYPTPSASVVNAIADRYYQEETEDYKNKAVCLWRLIAEKSKKLKEYVEITPEDCIRACIKLIGYFESADSTAEDKFQNIEKYKKIQKNYEKELKKSCCTLL